MSTTMPFCVERLGDERDIDHEGRAVQRLRRAEHLALERMGDHDVVADFDGVHAVTSLRQAIVDDAGTARALPGARISGKRAGQIVERRLAARAARRAGRRRASSSACCEPPAMRPARPVRRRDLADLARNQLQPAAVEGAAERHRHRRPRRTSSARRRSPRRRASRARWRARRCCALAWKTRSQSPGAASGGAKRSAAAPSASAARAGSMSTSVTSAPASCAQRKPTSAPTTPAPTTATALDRAGAGIPHGVERGLHVGGEHRARRRHASRHGNGSVGRQRRTRSGADAARRPCGRQAGGPSSTHADRGVAVFHREREGAAHERRAHALDIRWRDAARGDQRLGAAADRAVERAHPHRARRQRPQALRPGFRPGPARRTTAPAPSRHRLDAASSRFDPDSAPCHAIMRRMQSVDRVASVRLCDASACFGALVARLDRDAAGPALARGRCRPGGFGAGDLPCCCSCSPDHALVGVGFWNAAIGLDPDAWPRCESRSVIPPARSAQRGPSRSPRRPRS